MSDGWKRRGSACSLRSRILIPWRRTARCLSAFTAYWLRRKAKISAPMCGGESSREWNPVRSNSDTIFSVTEKAQMVSRKSNLRGLKQFGWFMTSILRGKVWIKYGHPWLKTEQKPSTARFHGTRKASGIFWPMNAFAGICCSKKHISITVSAGKQRSITAKCRSIWLRIIMCLSYRAMISSVCNWSLPDDQVSERCPPKQSPNRESTAENMRCRKNWSAVSAGLLTDEKHGWLADKRKSFGVVSIGSNTERESAATP